MNDVSAQEELNDIACPSWEQVGNSVLNQLVLLGLILVLIVVPSML